MSRIMTIVDYQVKPQHRDAFIEIAKGHAARSRAQDGCQQFDVLLANEVFQALRAHAGGQWAAAIRQVFGVRTGQRIIFKQAHVTN